MVIRQETPNDYNEIYDLVKEAFATAYSGSVVKTKI